MFTNVCGHMRDLEAEAIAYKKRWDAIYAAGANVKAAKIARICARYELEPDEFYTAEQKAEQLIKELHLN